MQKKKHPYNDGMASFYRVKEITNTFGAKSNPVSKDDMEFIEKLAYTEKTKRQQDYEFAEQNSKELSKKIVTQLRKEINSNMKIIDDNVLYDVITIDFDRENNEMYIYLQEVREIAG